MTLKSSKINQKWPKTSQIFKPKFRFFAIFELGTHFFDLNGIFRNLLFLDHSDENFRNFISLEKFQIQKFNQIFLFERQPIFPQTSALF